MRLLWWEIKKIWRWQLVLVIIGLSVLYSYLLLEYYLPVVGDEFHGNAWGELSVASELLERFGPEMDAGERIEADSLLDDYFRQLEPWIAGHSIYAEKGIYTAADLRDCYEYKGVFEGKDNGGFDYYEVMFSPLFENEGGSETGHIMWKIQALSYALDWYDNIGGDGVYAFEINNSAATVFQSTRAEALTERGAYRNINCNVVLENTTRYAKQAVIIILLSVAVLLLPFLVTDNTRSMAQMQWSTRSGRGTLKTQFRSAILSAFALVTIEVAVITGLFMAFNKEFLRFGSQLIYTGLGYVPVPWLDMTYAQYAIAIIILCYILSIGLAAILTFLSYKSQNPTALLLKSIPVYVASAIIGYQVMNATLTFYNSISRLTRIPCADALLCFVVFLIGGAMWVHACRQAQKVDLA